MDPSQTPQVPPPTVPEQIPIKPTSGANKIIGFLVVCIIILVGLVAYFFGKSKKNEQSVQKVTAPSQAVISIVQTPTSIPNTPTEEVMGIVTGKLCYPSEVLPKGTIEAKNISTNEIVSQEYAGSQAGGASTYSFELKPGSYYVRFNSSTGLMGYQSETCKTGSETTCSESNPRVLTTALVETGKTFSGYDLCDFYYSEKTKPTF